MKKTAYLLTIFAFISLFGLVIPLNADADDNNGATRLQQILGIQPDADYVDIDLTTTTKDTVITATVDDPSKLGGCLKGDRVKLINLGNGEWKITRLETGSGFKFNVYTENGVMKINKTETFGKRIIVADTTKSIPNNSFSMGFDARYLEYEEEDLMEEDGWLYGVVGRYTHHGKNHFMFETSLNYVFGELDYDGQTWGGTPIEEDTDDWIFEGRVLLGGDFKIKSSSIITFFTGVGYRYWNDDIDGSGGYEREIEYWYLPIGVEATCASIKNWILGIRVEYDLFLGGSVKSHLSDVHPSFNDPKVDQDFGDGYGVKASLQIDRKLSKNYGLSIEPYITYWDIDESDTSTLTVYGIPVAYVVEPENETTAYGMRLTISFF